MARVIAIVTEISGEFFAKNQNGTIIELKNGTEILEGMVVYSNNNNPSDTINIHAFSGEDIVLAGNQEQLFDVTMIDSELADLDVALDEDSIASIVAANSADPFEYENEEEIFTEETASGDEKEKEEGDIAGGFAARDGNLGDVNSDLRDARFKILSNSYEVKSRFEREDGDRLEMINNTSTTATNTPSRPTPIESTPPTPTTPTTIIPPTSSTPPIPVVPVVPQTSVTLKLFAIDSTGKEVLANNGFEGSNVKYIVRAFDGDKEVALTGKVSIVFQDATAKGASNQTTQNGTQDYNNIPQLVTVGEVFTTQIFDDYIADNGENFQVVIDGNYQGSKGGFDIVNYDKTPVTTTIYDNSNPKGNTPHDPNDTPNHNQETDADIVTIKLFAADSNGNVIKDGSGNYVLANTAYEGNNAKYIAYAFKDGTITFNDNTKLGTQTGTVKVGFTDGTATGGTDFGNGEQTITIGTAFQTNIIIDAIAEGDENYTVAIKTNTYSGNYESVTLDTANVTTTIKDAKLFVKIEAVTDTAQEGANLQYKVSIVNSAGDAVEVPAGKSITVNLDYADNGTKAATSGVDYTPVTSVTIGAGESSKTFDVVTKDDFYAEGDEGLKITIGTIINNNGAFVEIATHTIANGAKSDKVEVIGTIKDNPANDTIKDPQGTPTETGGYGNEDTIYVKITGDSVKNEGQSLEHTVSLYRIVNGVEEAFTVDAGETITVTIGYTPDATKGATEGVDYIGTKSVTFTSGESSKIITNPTIDDYIADNGEKYTATITSVKQANDKYENVAIGTDKSVNGTINDDTDTTPNIAGTVEGNHELVILKIVAWDSVTGEAALEADDKTYKIVNDVNEGSSANYVVLAFKPDAGTTFTTETVLANDLQGGTVTIKTANAGATGVGFATAIDGSQDYISQTTKEVTVGTSFTIATIDDYRSDNGEQFKVSINNSSYKHPNNNVADAIYENVTTNNVAVTTTIKDNTPAKNQTVEDSTVDGSDYGKEDTVYAVITSNNATIVEGGEVTYTVKLVDKTGADVTVTNATVVMVTYTSSDTTKGVDTPYADGETITVIIPANGTSNTFTIKTIDDFVFDGAAGSSKEEQFKLVVTDVTSTEFENIVMNDASRGEITTTIKEGVTVGTPVNAKVDEDDFDALTANSTIKAEKISLGIQKPNADDAYTLSFDAGITVYKGKHDGALTPFVYGDTRTTLESGGKIINYKVDGNTITGYTGDEATYASNKVFEIVLNKDSAISSGTTTKDTYTYTQFKNIDHPLSGPATSIENDDDITFEFGFKITDQEQEGSVQKFKVTVNDSMPSNTDQTIVLNEDKTQKIVISPESFKDGKIEINNGIEIKILDLTPAGKVINIYDVSKTYVVGVLTNNGDGTVTFTPKADYSGKTAGFSYAGISDADGDTASAQVNITVKPIADAPKVTVNDVIAYEDANPTAPTVGNALEGGNVIALGLLVPELSKDQKDQNDNDIATGAGTHTGDHPERNGYIELKFTNGLAVSGAILEKENGDDIAAINANDQTIKIFITDKANYHHSGLSPVADGAIQLTEDEYKNLAIIHAEDNDTDIKINIKTTSYEVNDSGVPLVGVASKSHDATMTVKIYPVTDDISLIWKNDGGLGTIDVADATNKTFTFTAINESTNETPQVINLTTLLTKTSGTEANDGTAGNKADLDGSEKRTYVISKIPEGTIVTLGGQKAIAGSDGIATLVFNDVNNKLADPDFSIEFPKFYSGTITNAEIKLSVYDKGVDAGDTAGVVKSEIVKFSIIVNPVAQQSTIQVGQSVGFEDAGRSGGNTDAKSDTINDAANGITLDIKVTSDDKDGSEKFTVTIGEIPDGGAIYYNGRLYDKTGDITGSGAIDSKVSVDATGTGWAIIITEFDNTNPPKFIPPHNDDSDHTLKVSSVTNDGTSVSGATTKDILVVVKNVADAPVGTELDTNIIATEDTSFNLKSIYTHPENLKSYDGTEELTVKIKLTTGFTLKAGTPYYIEDGEYVVKASDIIANKILIDMPTNFSGSAELKLTYVTTEKAGEGDSKTWNTQTVNIFVNPVADNVTVATGSTIHEDADGSANKINLKPALTDTGTTHGAETITSVKILGTSVPAGYKLYSDANMTTELTKTGSDYVITSITDSIYAKNATPHAVSVDFTLKVEYTVKDTNGTKSDEKTFSHEHVVTVKAVTDAPTIAVTETTTTDTSKVEITNSDKTITVSADNVSFTVKVKTTSDDKDDSEEVQRIEIHGVPKGVTIDGASYKGHSGTDSGVWVIENPTDKILDADGAFTEIKFTIENGSDFTGRDITIKTFTKDVEASEETKSINIRLNDFRPGQGTGPGTQTTPDFELTAKSPTISEDTKLTLDDFYSVSSTKGEVTGSHWATTITGLPEGTKVEAINGATIFTYTQDGQTHYVISGTGQQASDIQNVFKNIEITPP
ncbi:MAG: cadherin-like domain-containing protein, partial [Sulfurimonadaceae bacterium]|nr:cadherin-like domain-containing protein [Sulfurimonadaceae bacterium]